MSDQSKDTIYIDIDDEITTIIDKVRGSSHKLVALVLPKRAAVLQSVVNMKLLKRTADDEKKNIVLITSEAGLLPLAGSVGLYVAKTLQTKPILPEAPEVFADTDAIDEPVDVESEPTDFDPKQVADKPVGELAGGAAAAAAKDEPSGPSKSANPLVPDETIDLNEDELAASETVAESIAEKKKNKKEKKNKKLKVPNFIRFRRVLILFVIFLIIVIVGLVYLIKVLPKATIAIQTSNSSINTNLTVTLSTATKTLDSTNLVVPATQQQVTKTNSQEVPTTGQENNGAEATGTVSMTAQECAPNVGQPPAVPAGTGITANGLTFITQGNTTFPVFGSGKGSCVNYQATNTTSVTAQSGGSQYNLGPTSFSVAGRQDVSASSTTAFSGGTDSIVNIVAQADVNSATQKIAAQDTTTIKQQLANDLQQAGLEPITATFTAGTPSITTSPAVGTQADNVTVTQSINYTMLGVPESDLVTLVDNSVNSQINSSSQSILSNGVSNANVSLLNQSSGQAQVSLAATSTVGSELNISTIKNQIVGKKSGDVQSTISGYPGVKSVTVHFSPFWVNTVPSNTSKIDITILKASGS